MAKRRSAQAAPAQTTNEAEVQPYIIVVGGQPVVRPGAAVTTSARKLPASTRLSLVCATGRHIPRASLKV